MTKRVLIGVGQIIGGTFLFGQGIDMVCNDTWGLWGGLLPKSMILAGGWLMLRGWGHVGGFINRLVGEEKHDAK